MTRFLFLALAFVFYAPPAFAQIRFSLEDTTIAPGTGEKVLQALYPAYANKGYGPTVEQDLAPQIQSLRTQLTNDISAKIAAIQYQSFLQQMAFSGSGATHNAGIDPASRADVFSLTIEGAAASNGLTEPSQLGNFISDVQNGEAPSFGAGADGAVTVGLNLGAFFSSNGRFWDPSRLTLYGTGMRLSLNFEAQDLKTQFLRWGVHGKYRVLFGRSFAGGLVRANGVDVVTGFSYSRQQAQIGVVLPSGQETQQGSIVGQSYSATVQYSGNAIVNADLHYLAIPVGVVSSIQFLHALTLFGGIGFDINVGSATLTATAKEPAVVRLSNSDNKSVTILMPAATLDANLVARPSVIDGRVFAGLQLGTAPLAVFAQVAAETSKTLAVNGGLRIFW